MNYSFGATPQQPQQGAGGFSFGQSTPNNQPRIAFGQTPNPSGFSFGPPPASQQPSATGPSFTFGATPQNAQNSGFAFGAATQPTATTSGFSFSSSTPVASQSGGFNFSAAQPQPASGFSFGAPQTTASNTGFSFATPAVTTSSFAFNASQNPAFSFGKPAQTTTSGFAFGSTPAAATTTTITTSATASGFGFGSTPSSGLGFGAPPTTTAVAPAFGFGTPASSAQTASPFGFGTTNASMNLTTAQVQPQAPTPSGGGFAFGPTTTAATATPSMFTFGNNMAPATSSVSFSFGTPTTSAPSFGFGAPTPASSATMPTFGTPATVASTVATLGTGGFQPASTTTSAFGFPFPTANQNPPASSAPSAAPPSTGFSFGVPPSSTPSISSSVASTPFNVPAAGNAGGDAARPSGDQTLASSTSIAPPAFSVPSTSIPESTSSIFSTSSLAPSTTTPTVSSTAPGFGFGTTPSSTAGFSFGQTTAPAGSSISFSSATNSTPLSGFSVPKTSGSLFPASTTLTTSAPSTLMFGDSSSSLSATSVPSSTAAALTTPTTVTPSSAAAPTPMNFRQLEDAINKWKSELDEEEKLFFNQATRVNAWDRLLINNAEKITSINDMMERSKVDQERLDQELDFIMSQQIELENSVLSLEKNTDSLISLNAQQRADVEREHTFHLAENIDAQLKRMSDDIKEIIEYLNTANKTQDDSDPVLQIAKILNAHMDALKSIECSTVTLQKRLESTAKYCEMQKKDVDRSFRNYN